jgi:predicted AlkP superfamily phosphohydrolase/phosphomutase
MIMQGVKVVTALALGLSFAVLGAGCGDGAAQAPQKKVLILGFDGMDPQILKRLVQEDKLPHFARLMKTGDFKPLATSMPPQSPVAWATFITGMNPGGHGIFDFIHIDPATMAPYLSTSRAEPAKRTIRIGEWNIPLASGTVTLLRQGKAFWEILEEHGVPTTIFRVPANFPPAETPARQISGMGTPDIQGTYGTFSFYTSEPAEKYGEVSGGKVFPIEVVDNKVQARLFGPQNSFRQGSPPSAADFTVFLDPEHPVTKIRVQDRQILLQEGEWSEWVKVNFEVLPLLHSVNGICRFYLKQMRPHFKLYVTPVNIDPAAPALPITTPDHYAEELADEIGPFYTQGIPEDTKALSEEVLTDEEFMQQANLVLAEELKMFEYELSRFKAGVLFFYIGRTDQLAHMFWRTMDPHHPAYDATNNYQYVIEQTYREVDGVLGKALETLDEQTTVIVLSDHGFAPFYRAFNLNTWLKNEGYTSLRDDTEGELLLNVNWAKTRAYGVGFNGLSLNLQGRERRGVVRAGAERQQLLDEIVQKLLAVHDPKTGERVFLKVHKAEELYTGPYVKNAPDLILGYNKGYRASWETVLGKFPKELLRDNTEKWSGDHLMEAELVPGILLANKKITTERPALSDLAPTVLAEFGIAKQDGMIGSGLFQTR